MQMAGELSNDSKDVYFLLKMISLISTLVARNRCTDDRGVLLVNYMILSWPPLIFYNDCASLQNNTRVGLSVPLCRNLCSVLKIHLPTELIDTRQVNWRSDKTYHII